MGESGRRERKTVARNAEEMRRDQKEKGDDELDAFPLRLSGWTLLLFVRFLLKPLAWASEA